MQSINVIKSILSRCCELCCLVFRYSLNIYDGGSLEALGLVGPQECYSADRINSVFGSGPISSLRIDNYNI